MRLEQLEYFLDVSKTKSLNASAERLFITQPTISEAIHKLEVELDTELLTRSKKGVELTNAGEIVQQWASIILDNIKQMKEDVWRSTENYNPDLVGDICIGATSFSNGILLPDVLAGFAEHYPSVGMTVFNVRQYEMADFLKSKTIELAIFNLFEQDYFQVDNEEKRLLLEDEAIQSTLFYSEPIQIIAHKQFPISREKTVDLQTALQYPIVVFANYGKTKKAVVRFLESLGEVNFALKTDNVQLMRHMVLEGTAIGLSTKRSFGSIFFDDDADNVLRVIRLKEHLRLDYYLAYLAGKKLNMAEKAFIAYMQDCLTEKA